jgi:hypothetical protein
VAVCLTNAGAGNEPNAFNFDLMYDDSLNHCVPVPCGPGDACLDSNPDANTGVTVFSTPSLGNVGYDCSGVGVAPPVCDSNTGDPGPGQGRAYIGCFTVRTPTLPVGDGVSAPIAEVTFHATAGGVDNLSLENVDVFSQDLGDRVVACPGDIGECLGGTDNKTGGPPATTAPTASSTPAATATLAPLCGLPGVPTCTPTPKPYTATPTAKNTFTPTRTPRPTRTTKPTSTPTPVVVNPVGLPVTGFSGVIAVPGSGQATIRFSRPMHDDNFGIMLTPAGACQPSVSSKTRTGFTLSCPGGGDVQWMVLWTAR